MIIIVIVALMSVLFGALAVFIPFRRMHINVVNELIQKNVKDGTDSWNKGWEDGIQYVATASPSQLEYLQSLHKK